MRRERAFGLRERLPEALLRAGGLGLLWWLLAGDDPQSWLIGAPAVLGATAAGMALAPPARLAWRPGGLARFVPFFLWQSLLGGVDVAWRALHPRLPIDPGMQTYRVRLPEAGRARPFLANLVSLLPGTLSADLDGDRLLVHAVDRRQPLESRIAACEARVADLLGVELAEGAPPPAQEGKA